MKRIFLLLLPLLMIGTMASAAQESFYVKAYAGVIGSTSIDNKIEITDTFAFEDYEGNPGVETRIAVGAARLEVAYILQTYSAEKDGKTPDGTQTEKGKLDFTTETLDVAGYLFEKGIKSGFNLSVGVGRGTTTFKVDEYSLDGASQAAIEGYEAYMKEFHYHADIHYAITEMFDVTGSYMSQTISPIDGSSFTNTMISLFASVKF